MPLAADGQVDLPKVELGLAKKFMLYDLGEGPTSRPDFIHVDDGWVYWTHNVRLMRAPKDGSGTPEWFATYQRGNGGFYIATDATYVYWLARELLTRKPKLGGPEETVTLMWDHTGGDFNVAGGFVYVAMWGCAAITRVSTETLESETMYIDVGVPQAGDTSLIVDGEALYCGSWGQVFKVPRWGEEAVRLVNSATRVAGVAVENDEVYWLDDRAAGPHAIGKLQASDGAIETFMMPGGRGLSPFAHDRAGRRLFFIHGSWVVAFSLVDHGFSYLTRDYVQHDLAVDDQYVYWAHYQNYDGVHLEHGRIARMPLNVPALRIVRCGSDPC